MRVSRLLGVFGCVLALVAAGPAPANSATGPGELESQLSLGESVLGRQISANVREGAGNPTRSVVVIGQLHGNEAAGPRVVAAISELPLPDGLRVYLIPTVNPDGRAGFQRTNSRGVDLNRNFPVGWARSGKGATYSGPRKSSEPETRAVRDFLASINPAAVVILHQPLNGVDTSIAKTRALARKIAAETGLPRKQFRCSGTCHGTLTMWFNATFAGDAVTVELPGKVSAAQVDKLAAALVRALA